MKHGPFDVRWVLLPGGAHHGSAGTAVDDPLTLEVGQGRQALGRLTTTVNTARWFPQTGPLAPRVRLFPSATSRAQLRAASALGCQCGASAAACAFGTLSVDRDGSPGVTVSAARHFRLPSPGVLLVRAVVDAGCSIERDGVIVMVKQKLEVARRAAEISTVTVAATNRGKVAPL